VLSAGGLFAVLWASSHDPEGTFEPPWRSVSGALGLVSRLAMVLPDDGDSLSQRFPTLGAVAWRAIDDITRALEPYLTSQRYEQLDNLLDDVRRSPPSGEGELVAAGLRICQLAIANSHGGGHAYNSPLRRAAETLLDRGWIEPDALAQVIERARLHDALGSGADAKKREAFRTCWRAKRYALAYCL
jgi:hypothetical protein